MSSKPIEGADSAASTPARRIRTAHARRGRRGRHHHARPPAAPQPAAQRGPGITAGALCARRRRPVDPGRGPDRQGLQPRPVFCAGYHIGELDDGREPEISFEDVVSGARTAAADHDLRLPGSVRWCHRLCTCLRFSARRAGHGDAHARRALGIHYYPSGMRRYVTRMGLAAAKKAFLTALPLSAEDLLEVDYLDEVWPPDELATAVVALCARICALAPLAIQDMKRSLNEIARGEVRRSPAAAARTHSKATADFAEDAPPSAAAAGALSGTLRKGPPGHSPVPQATSPETHPRASYRRRSSRRHAILHAPMSDRRPRAR